MFKTLTESFAIGNEISPEALREIQQKGYRTIVDLCTPEEGNKLNPEEMKRLDFEYLRVPVPRENINSQTLQVFIEAVNCASYPIYTRCASGLRA